MDVLKLASLYIKSRLPSSLSNRVFLSAFIVLVSFGTFSLLFLDQVYKRNILEKYTEQLQLHLFGLLSIVDLDESEFQITSLFYDQRFDIVSSELIAIVYDSKQERIWDSLSSKKVHFEKPPKGTIGRIKTDVIKSTDKQKYLIQNLSVIWDLENGDIQELTVVVGFHDSIYRPQLMEFRKKLLLGGFLITFLILVLQRFILFLGFKNFDSIASDLKQISRGEKNRLDGDYPTELQTVSRAINQLIINERAQKDRYQKTLGDLAHSLKTPLSVLQSFSENLENKEIYAEQIERIDQIISYQLHRAVRTAPALSAQPVNIENTINEIKKALDKVYSTKQVKLQNTIMGEPLFYGSKNDLMELLGNLLDNAYKLCNKTIKISIYSKISKNNSYQLSISIEDDGKGIAKEEREFVLQRGSRADTLNLGQGIGLAVVVDIINHYQGKIEVKDSKLGGAFFEMQFSHTLL